MHEFFSRAHEYLPSIVLVFYGVAHEVDFTLESNHVHVSFLPVDVLSKRFLVVSPQRFDAREVGRVRRKEEKLEPVLVLLLHKVRVVDRVVVEDQVDLVWHVPGVVVLSNRSQKVDETVSVGRLVHCHDDVFGEVAHCSVQSDRIVPHRVRVPLDRCVSLHPRLLDRVDRPQVRLQQQSSKDVDVKLSKFEDLKIKGAHAGLPADCIEIKLPGRNWCLIAYNTQLVRI